MIIISQQSESYSIIMNALQTHKLIIKQNFFVKLLLPQRQKKHRN